MVVSSAARWAKLSPTSLSHMSLNHLAIHMAVSLGYFSSWGQAEPDQSVLHVSEPPGHPYGREFELLQQLAGQAEPHQSALDVSEPPGNPYGCEFGKHQQLRGQAEPQTSTPDHGQVQGKPQLNGGHQHPQQAVLH